MHLYYALTPEGSSWARPIGVDTDVLPIGHQAVYLQLH